jgi:predicted phage gp36 major capsid-like protein
MKDHAKKFKEIQERAFREAEEKKRLRQEQQEKIETAEEKYIKIEKGKEKEKEIRKETEIEQKIKDKTASSLDGNAMATPTPQDFYNLQEQFSQMQAMLSQFCTSNQQSNQDT